MRRAKRDLTGHHQARLCAELAARGKRLGKALGRFGEPTCDVQRLAEMLNERRVTQRVSFGRDQTPVRRFRSIEVASVPTRIGEKRDQPAIVWRTAEELPQPSFSLGRASVEQRHQRFKRGVVGVRRPKLALVIQHRQQRHRVVVPAVDHEPRVRATATATANVYNRCTLEASRRHILEFGLSKILDGIGAVLSRRVEELKHFRRYTQDRGHQSHGQRPAVSLVDVSWY